MSAWRLHRRGGYHGPCEGGEVGSPAPGGPRLRAPGFAHAPLGLLTFVSGDPVERAVLLEEGVFGWRLAPDFRMAFWRPLSTLTHVLGHVLWPRAFVLAHEQSMARFTSPLDRSPRGYRIE